MSRLTVVRASRRLVYMWMETLLFQLFLVHIHKRKRDRDQNVLPSSKDSENLQKEKSLNGKLTRPSEEREWLSKKLHEAEAEVEATNWAERNSDIAFHETDQEFESQRFQPHQASRRADQAQRDKKAACMEYWNFSNRLFKEDHAREIAKK